MSELNLSSEASHRLLPTTQKNLQRVYRDPAASAVERASIEELLEKQAWSELDDRFYRDIAFGTGGMRGRTIGKIVTAAERGTPQPLDRPEFPSTGTNLLNFGNVHRAVSALGTYLLDCFPGTTPRVIISHDTRYFSRAFAEAAARSLNALGVAASLFAEDRSTPQLSFAVRHEKAQAGIMITASHNPPHDNGMKFYFADGGQVIEPHASGITEKFQQFATDPDALTRRIAAVTKPGTTEVLGPAIDAAYMDAVANLVLEPEAIAATRGQIKLVYTPLHGTGMRATPALLERFGFQFSIVPEQAVGDPRFPTVASPNPENAEALTLALAQAEREGADLVLATDPDCDRLGIAVRNGSGQLVLLTGNQIGSILAHYRTSRLMAQGVVTPENKSRAVLVKTFVTTDLQRAIARHFGVRCLETLTGFKYIGAKMLDYEKALGLSDGKNDRDYDQLSAAEQRALLLEKSHFIIYGGEESYGYTGGDYVRDKDGNAAALMVAEAAAWAKSQGQTLVDYLEAIYREVGYYAERLGTLTFEGAQGAQKIQKLLASFRAEPPTSYQGQTVTRVQDFGRDEVQDIDGRPIPKETMLLFYLADGGRLAVRGSGTEPKIKFYFFTRADLETKASAAQLEKIKEACAALLAKWWEEVQADVQRRVGVEP